MCEEERSTVVFPYPVHNTLILFDTFFLSWKAENLLLYQMFQKNVPVTPDRGEELLLVTSIPCEGTWSFCCSLSFVRSPASGTQHSKVAMPSAVVKYTMVVVIINFLESHDNAHF